MATLIQEDAPHPHSYRPDLPFGSELKGPRTYEAGIVEGQKHAADEVEFLEWSLEREKRQRIALTGEITALQDRLDQANSRLLAAGAQEA